MSLAATSVFADRPELSAIPSDVGMDVDSPFGLQGLTRDSIVILKPNCINKLGVDLALRGTPDQIRDPEFVKRVMSYHPEWLEEYRIVHLLEKSLWLQGQSDLVMTMTKNPAQIPDNPPDRIMKALTRAITLHPEATFWYGVPLFGDEKNAEGLPIPVTAGEVRSEADERIVAAQEHALRWGWLYRSALSAVRVPSKCWHYARLTGAYFQHAWGRMNESWRQAREDARYRLRATAKAELEQTRYGRALTEIPEHRTMLGRGIDSAGLVLELLAYQASFAAHVVPLMGAMAGPLAVASYVPTIFIPLTVISLDPFLFVELPDEPGKLRHIGHWYWQSEGRGKKKLHLHI